MTSPEENNTTIHPNAAEQMLAHVRKRWIGYLLSYAIALGIAILVLRNLMEVTILGIANFTLCWLASAYLDFRLHRQLANRNTQAT